AGGNQEVAVDQVHDAIGQIGREVRAIVRAAVFAKTAGYVHPGKALAQGEFYIGGGLIIAQQNVEARLLLLDEVVFQSQDLAGIGDDDVIGVGRLTHQSAGFGVLPAALVEIGADPAAQVVGLADVDDLTLSVLVEVNAGRGREGADFLGDVHPASFILVDCRG